MNQQFNLSDNSFKKRKEKAWEWRNMQGKNIHSMKNF